MTIAVHTLISLDEDQFADELQENLGWSEPGWSTFLDHQVVRRTRDALEEMQAKVTQQLESHTGEASTTERWLKKATNFKTLVTHRLRSANRTIQEMEGGFEKRLSAWKRFAHDLAEIVEDSDLADELTEVTIPVGGLNAKQWIDRRREKAREAAAQRNPLDDLLVAA